MDAVQFPCRVWILGGLLLGCGALPDGDDNVRVNVEFGDDPAPEELMAQGHRLLKLGEHATAQNAFLGAASAAAERKDSATLAEALAESAAGSARAGEVQQAEKLLQAAEACEVAHDSRAWIRVLATRGYLLYLSGNEEGAAWAYEEAFSIATESGQFGQALASAHRLAVWSPPEQRSDWAREGILLARAQGELRWEARLEGVLGLSLERSGRTAESLQAQLRSRRLHYASGGDIDRLRADWVVGRAYRVDGRPQAALEWMSNVLGRAELRFAAKQDSESKVWVALAQRELALIEQSLGHEDLARMYERRADELLNPTGTFERLALNPRSWFQGLADWADGL